jgi:hypothetical protein
MTPATMHAAATYEDLLMISTRVCCVVYKVKLEMAAQNGCRQGSLPCTACAVMYCA